MEFEDSGIDSDQRIDSTDLFNDNGLEPAIISFSPNHSRYPLTSTSFLTFMENANLQHDQSSSEAALLSLDDSPLQSPNGSSNNLGTTSNGSFFTGNDDNSSTTTLIDYSSFEPNQQPASMASSPPAPTKSTNATSPSTNTKQPLLSSSKSDLQKRLEKRIARANSTSSANNSPLNDPTPSLPSPRFDSVQVTTVTKFGKNRSPKQFPDSNSAAVSYDGPRRPPQLLPATRLAIPNKHNKKLGKKSCNSTGRPPSHSEAPLTDDAAAGETVGSCGSESKPLVEWESDNESEDDTVTFFPNSKNRALLNENLSIDMSLEDEDDLHLAPPRPLSQRCPCDPRLILESIQQRRRELCSVV